MQKKEAESRILFFFFLQFSLSLSRKATTTQVVKRRFPERLGSVRGTEEAAEGQGMSEKGMNPASASAPRCRQERRKSPAWSSADSRWADSCQSSQKQTCRWLNEGLKSCSGMLSARRPALSWNETPLVGRMNFKTVCWTYARVIILILHAAQMHN